MTEIPQGGSCSQMDTEIVDQYFFPQKYHPQRATVKMAKRICNNCVIQQECLDYALDNKLYHGIMGGKTPHERFLMSEEGEA